MRPIPSPITAYDHASRFGRAVGAVGVMACMLNVLSACNGSDANAPKQAAGTTATTTFMGNAVVGSTIDAPVRLVVTDEHGMALGHVPVRWSANDGGSTAFIETTSDDNGIAQVKWTLGTMAGMQTLVAYVETLAPVTFTANALADRPAAVRIGPTSVLVTLIGDTVRVQPAVSDKYGNAVNVAATVTVESGAAAVSLTPVNFVVGKARGAAVVRFQADTAISRLSVLVDPAPPFLDAMAPDTLVPGAPVVLTGQNFALLTDAVDVSVAGVKATVTSVSATRIEAMVAASSAYACQGTDAQPVKVTIAGTSALRNAPFRVATRVTMARGESVNLMDGDKVRCTEVVQPQGMASRAKYVMAVLNTSITAAATSGFEMRGFGTGGLAGQIAQLDPNSMRSNVRSAGATALSAAQQAALNIDRAAEAAHARFLDRQRLIQAQVGSPAPVWRALRAARGNVAAAKIAAAVGDTVTMKAIYSSCSTGRDIRARVVYSGSKSVVLEDVLAPRAGTMDADYVAVGQEFDHVQYPLLQSKLADPLAMDQTLGGDGRITMLFTRYVNDSLPGIAGYVTACNFYSKGTFAASNEDEVFYARVAALGETSDAWRRTMRSTVIHEAKHLGSFAQRFVSNTPFEESWLEEATARVAEELYSRTFSGGGSWKGNVGYTTSVQCEIYQCDSRPLMMWKHFSVLDEFYRGVDTLTPIGAAASGDFTFYASGWSLVRWAADQYATDETQWMKDLIRGGQLTGLSNLALRTGRPVTEMLADWSLANAVDDLSGFTPARPQLSFPSWNVPDIMRGLNFADPTRFNDATPLKVRAFTFGTFAMPVTKLRAFSSSYFSFEGLQNGNQLVELRGENGGVIPSTLRIAVVRVE